MSIAERLDALRTCMREDSDYARLIEAGRRVLVNELQIPGVKQPNETRDWWYTSEDRLGRAAVIWALTEDAHIGAWLHDTALMIAREDADAWIGPFFRKRYQPLQGMLETRHLSAAVSQALLFAPALFTDAEMTELRTALREKALIPIMEWLKPYDADPSIPHNNWVISELTGLFFAACAIGDFDCVRHYLPLFNFLHNDCNSDFYGEPGGYWIYACDSFLKIHFLLDWAFDAQSDEVESPARLLSPFLWKYYRRQGMFQLQNFESSRMRGLTFGDDPTLDSIAETVLLYTSVYHMDFDVRGLAGTRLEKLVLSDPDKERAIPCEFLCLLPYRGTSQVTEDAFPPSRLFADGYLMYKDRWDAPTIQIALLGGCTETPHVIEHAHADQLSFQLAVNGVVLLDDPSICCYRLNMYRQTQSAAWHSVPSYRTEEETPRLLEQARMTSANIREEHLCRRVSSVLREHAFAVTGDASALYPAELRSVRRTFAAAGEHVLVICDTWESDIPVFPMASFIGNNRRRMMKWNFGENCASLSREGVGVRILAMQNTSVELDYAALNDSNDVYPDSPMQGREGSGYIVRMQAENSACHGKAVYVLFADREENLEHWHAEIHDTGIVVTENGNEIYCFQLGESVSILHHGVDLLQTTDE